MIKYIKKAMRKLISKEKKTYMEKLKDARGTHAKL